MSNYSDSSGNASDSESAPPPTAPHSATPVLVSSSSNTSSPNVHRPSRAIVKKSSTRLVAWYGDDDDDPNDDDGEESAPIVEEDAEEDPQSEDSDSYAPPSYSSEPPPEPEDDLIPPPPPGKCSKELQDKMIRLLRKRELGSDYNHTIQSNKMLRNPSIYEKLLQYLDIDELGTNYPTELFDPSKWPKEGYYDELARLQKMEMDRREREKKEKGKVEFVAAESTSDEPKRKSKWDAPQTSHPVLSQASGTKSTVIPATGMLNKKK